MAELTWHIDVHGHNAVAATNNRVGVVVIATAIGTAGERVVRRLRRMVTSPPHTPQAGMESPCHLRVTGVHHGTGHLVLGMDPRVSCMLGEPLITQPLLSFPS